MRSALNLCISSFIFYRLADVHHCGLNERHRYLYGIIWPGIQ